MKRTEDSEVNRKEEDALLKNAIKKVYEDIFHFLSSSQPTFSQSEDPLVMINSIKVRFVSFINCQVFNGIL